MTLDSDARAAARWARNILQCNPLILDTETTGLQDIGEVCQIAIIDAAGATLLDALVKPSRPIPPTVTRIHGISNEMVADAPRWTTLVTTVSELVIGRSVIIYNVDFDVNILNNTHRYAGCQETNWWTLADWNCAMLKYAEFWGDWNEYRGAYAWQKLVYACQQQRIPDPVAPAHSALGDCLRTLAVVRAMANAADEATEAEERS